MSDSGVLWVTVGVGIALAAILSRIRVVSPTLEGWVELEMEKRAERERFLNKT